MESRFHCERLVQKLGGDSTYKINMIDASLSDYLPDQEAMIGSTYTINSQSDQTCFTTAQIQSH